MAVHFAQLNDIKNTIAEISAVEWDKIAKGDKEYPEQLGRISLRPNHFDRYGSK